ncbi:MAG: hypothetical protein JNM51_14740 [Bacteroidia bacterium]|jgi:YVTN family beta-propeller protein|nr:hypothetical protein [Bacteroidia bacterium]
MMISLKQSPFILLVAVGLFTLVNCTKDKALVSYKNTGYPDEVAKIIMNKCATSGCHNEASKGGAAGLSLASWDKLFEGSNSGAVIIPYSPNLSTFLYYTNSYNEYGTIQLVPKMPIGSPALSNSQIKTLYDWIASGAPNADGFVKFSDNPNRKKFYVSNQGCDIVTVFDAQSMLAMGTKEVGKTSLIEAPHFIKVSPDNKYWYVSFLGASVFQKYRVSDNSFVGEANIGIGSWNTFAISSDGKYAYVVDWSSNGKIKKVQTDSMLIKGFVSGLIYPHGSALNQTNDTLYVTSQIGNYLFKIPTDFSIIYNIILDNSGMANNTSSLDPHEIMMSPDYSKYFVTCQKSNEIKVVDRLTGQVITSIPVGGTPQEMAISTTKNYLFVSCMEDITTFGSSKRGSVYVININTHAVVGSVYTGHQPHGLMVDEQNKRVYVTNRNVALGGPAPHHAALCSGQNGYVTAIDLNTLQLIQGFRAEVSVDPYGYSITH